MADKIVINVRGYAGEYDFDIDEVPLTNREWQWVKKISGYVPLTIEEGWRGGDPDVFVAFAVVALVRAGKVEKADALTVADKLMDAPFDGAAIMVVGDPAKEEDEQNPPTETPVTEPPLRSIGGSSRPTLGPPEDGQSLTGPPGSPRSVTSGLVT